MIFQDPFACLHPMYRVGDQIAEAVKAHAKVSNSQANARAVELLDAGRHPERARPRARLPAPVLGRHAPARDDRDGARPQPRRADRRRAHDRARRDRAGADRRADRPREEGVRHRRDPDHARPRRHRRDGDARDGHVRRPRARVRPGARDLQRGAGPVHVGPAGVDADRRPPARAAGRDRGLAAVAARTRRRAARSTRAASTASSRATRSGRRSCRCPAATSTPATFLPSASARSGRSASASSSAWSERDGRVPQQPPSSASAEPAATRWSRSST